MQIRPDAWLVGIHEDESDTAPKLASLELCQGRIGRGFQFEAHARLGPIPVTTQERYDGDEAHSRIRLLGLIPVATKTGPDALRAARQRFLVESIWLPSPFLPQFGAVWSEQNGRLRLVIPIHGQDVAAALQIGPAGELRELHIDRWSDLTDDRSDAWIPFVSVEDAHAYGVEREDKRQPTERELRAPPADHQHTSLDQDTADAQRLGQFLAADPGRRHGGEAECGGVHGQRAQAGPGMVERMRLSGEEREDRQQQRQRENGAPTVVWLVWR